LAQACRPFVCFVTLFILIVLFSMSDTSSRFFGSAIGAAIAESVTLPTDVAKVRLQVQNSSGQVKDVPYSGMANCLQRMAKEEGPRALWKGYTPALVRQICYTSLSLVLYEPVRNVYAGMGEAGAPPTFLQRLLAGGTAGAIAISVFNPTEVVKTQVQTSKDALGPGAVIKRVYARDGVFGFWAGLKPNIARTFLVNAAELGTYDEAKTRIGAYLGEGIVTHVGASTVAGFASACTSTPADVVKTRLMDAAGSENRKYTSVVGTFRTILSEEGFFALYKGFTPIVTRKMIWCTVFFVSYEQLRAVFNAGQRSK